MCNKGEKWRVVARESEAKCGQFSRVTTTLWPLKISPTSYWPKPLRQLIYYNSVQVWEVGYTLRNNGDGTWPTTLEIRLNIKELLGDGWSKFRIILKMSCVWNLKVCYRGSWGRFELFTALLRASRFCHQSTTGPEV